MALKDTLAQLRQQEEQVDQWKIDLPKFVESWKQDIVDLLQEIRAHLIEYQADRSMSFTDAYVDLSEEELGSYRASMMYITAPPAVIVVVPVGRMVVGAMGRVDMYLQGRVAEGDRISILRMPKSQRDRTLQWVIARPTNNLLPGITPLESFNGPWGAGRFAPLTKETLEISIEFLLIKR